MAHKKDRERRVPPSPQDRTVSSTEPGEEWIPLQQAIASLAEYDVPGYGNRESARQRIVDRDELPHKMVGKRHFVLKTALHALLGQQPAGPANMSSEDQLLIRYFLADPAHDAIGALAEGIARSVVHATAVWNEFRASPTAARAAATALAKKREEERLAREEAAKAWRCPECHRSDQTGAEEQRRVVQEVVPGRQGDFYIIEEVVLATFGAHRCMGCVRWRADAPTAAMREHLEEWRRNEEAATAAPKGSVQPDVSAPAPPINTGGAEDVPKSATPERGPTENSS
jgi:hypothetical protein